MNQRVKLFFSVVLLGIALAASSVGAEDWFKQGSQDYFLRNYPQAAKDFSRLAAAKPSAGAFHNLGNAEWQSGHVGLAILAWERAAWLSPYDGDARENLRYARKVRLLDAPDLTWFEVCSTWLPVNAWPWIAGATFWCALGILLFSNIFKWSKKDWHQAVAAALFAIFLLTLPALLGVQTRSRLGVVLGRNAALLLTPTSEGQSLSRCSEGEVVRLGKERGHFIFVRTANSSGWLDRDQLGAISGF